MYYEYHHTGNIQAHVLRGSDLVLIDGSQQ